MMRLLEVGSMDLLSTTSPLWPRKAVCRPAATVSPPHGHLLFTAPGARQLEEEQPNVEKFNDPTPLWRRLLRSRGHRRNALGLRTQPAGQGRQHRASTAACSLLVLVGGGPCSSSPAWRNLTAPRPSGTSPFDLRATFGSPETPSSSLLFSSGLASPPQPPAVCCCLLAAAPAGI